LGLEDDMEMENLDNPTEMSNPRTLPIEPQWQGSIDAPRYLIDLNMNQDQVAHKWLEFLITIEAGLAVAFAFLLRPGEGGGTKSLLHSALYLIGAIGVFVAVALTWIVVRERKWQSWYVARFNALSGCRDLIFPMERGNADRVGNQPLGRISQIVIALGVCIVAAWVIVLLSIG
jgi:hypothetical protein